MEPGETVEIPSMATSLEKNGFPEFMDNMLSCMIWDNREKIHDIVDAIIAQRKRLEGKGRRKATSSSVSQTNYLLRPPKVTPTNAELRHKSYLCQPSRSNMEDILERRNSITTFAKQWEAARQHCSDVVKRIVDEAKKSKLKYYDESFYYDKRENMYPVGAPSDCTVGEPTMCARLSDLYPKAVLFADSVTSDDITQGSVGDCFFIGAVSALAASDPDQIKDLFVLHDVSVGVYGVCFFKCGGWEWVIVDDLIPVVKERSGNKYPLYASSTGVINELWPMILEKAYAKMHYNWSTVDGGWAKEAIVDMTGGVDMTIDFTKTDSEITYDRFHQQVTSDLTILACAVPDNVEKIVGGKSGRAGETSALYGLFQGHQYAVIDAKQTSDGIGFIRCRNPWGNEAEWTGPYGDNAAEWTRFANHKKELNPEFKDDGEFWMKFSDFKRYLGVIDIVTIFPDDYKVLTMFGKGTTDLLVSNTYVLQVAGGKTQLSVTLGQDDPKIRYGKEKNHEMQFRTYASLKLTIYKMKEIPTSHDGLRENMQGKMVSKIVRERSVTMSNTLDPGVYVIFPCVDVGEAADDVGMYLRIIGPPTANFAVHKYSEGEDARLVVGDCPLIEEAKGLGAEVLRNMTRSGRRLKAVNPGATYGGFTSSASIILPPSNTPPRLSNAETPELSDAEAEPASPVVKLHLELQEQRDYVSRLEAIIKQQQTQIESLNTKLTVATKAATRPSTATASSNPAVISPIGRILPSSNNGWVGEGSPTVASNKLPAAATAWERLRMTKTRLDDLITIVFKELGGGKDLSVEDAVNGVRLLVTTGTGLDDISMTNPVCAKGSRIDHSGFAQICYESIAKWEALKH